MKVLVLVQGFNPPDSDDEVAKFAAMQEIRLSIVDFLSNDEALRTAIEEAVEAPEGTHNVFAELQFYDEKDNRISPPEGSQFVTLAKDNELKEEA